MSENSQIPQNWVKQPPKATPSNLPSGVDWCSRIFPTITNEFYNPRAAVDTAATTEIGGATITRVADSDFIGGFCFEISITSGAGTKGIEWTSFDVGALEDLTIRLDYKKVSGSGNLIPRWNFDVSGVQSGAGVGSSLTIATSAQTKTSGVSDASVTIGFFRQAGTGASVWRVGNLVAVRGTLADPIFGPTNLPYFDASIVGTWENGTAHNSPTYVKAGTYNLQPVDTPNIPKMYLHPDGYITHDALVGNGGEFRQEILVRISDGLFDWLFTGNTESIGQFGVVPAAMRVANVGNGPALLIQNEGDSEPTLLVNGSSVFNKTLGFYKPFIFGQIAPDGTDLITFIANNGRHFKFIDKSGTADMEVGVQFIKMGDRARVDNAFFYGLGGGHYGAAADTVWTPISGTWTSGTGSNPARKTLTGVGGAALSEVPDNTWVRDQTTETVRVVASKGGNNDIQITAVINDANQWVNETLEIAEYQYKPFLFIAEDSNNRHASTGFLHGLFPGNDRRWRHHHNPANFATAVAPDNPEDHYNFPTSDTDSDVYAMVETLDTDLDTVTVNTTTETSIYSHSILGEAVANRLKVGQLGTNNAFYAKLVGTIEPDAATDRVLTIRLKYGSATLCTRSVTIDSGSDDLDWRINAFVAADDDTQAQKGYIEFLAQEQITDGRIEELIAYGTSTIDSRSAQTFDITVEWGTAGATFIKEYAKGEIQ